MSHELLQFVVILTKVVIFEKDLLTLDTTDYSSRNSSALQIQGNNFEQQSYFKYHFTLGILGVQPNSGYFCSFKVNYRWFS